MSPALHSAPKKQPKRKRIGELLVDAEVVLQKHVDEALTLQKEKGGKLVEVLMSLGHIDARTFAGFLSKQRGIPSLELANYQVPQDVISLIPGELARKHQIFPVDKMGKLLTIGMEFPLDTDAIEELEKFTGLKIKPFLCSPSDIRNAVNQHYPLKAGPLESAAVPAEDPAEAAKEEAKPVASEAQVETGIKLKNVVNLIKEIDGLPTLPQTVQRVREATDDPDVGLKDIAELISRDPPIAAKMLQLANSAAYGFQSRVEDIGHATSLLGARETYSAVLSSAILDVTESASGFDHVKYWNDSTFCAAAAKAIAQACAPALKSTAFMGGLLHDIGRFALAQTAPGQYGKIDSSLSGSALITEERKTFLIAHPEAGFFLAAHWDLPEVIADAIRFHHNPDLSRAEGHTAHIVALAARLTEYRNESEDGMGAFPDDCVAYCEKLGLDHLALTPLIAALSAATQAESH